MNITNNVLKKQTLTPFKGNIGTAKHSGFQVAFKNLVIAGIALTLTGCASLNIGESDYSCSGMPEVTDDGVKCMSARDVYQLTNSGEVPSSFYAEQESTRTETRTRRSKRRAAKQKNNQKVESQKVYAEGTFQPKITTDPNDVVGNYVTPNLPDRPVPIRTPAQVMRIWIAPWEDTNGDLNAAGYVYTEIEPRRWVIGDRSKEQTNALSPLGRN